MKLLLPAIALLLAAASAHGQAAAPAQPTPPLNAAPDYSNTYDAHMAAPVTVAPSSGPRCPWMNLGTAADLTGGEVKLGLKQDAKGQVEGCTFTRTSGAGTLEIAVAANVPVSSFAVAAGQQCPAKSTPLKAIGNEAVACRAQAASLVAGRVRDQIFTIRLALPDAALADKMAREAAEQVAGNLF